MPTPPEELHNPASAALVEAVRLLGGQAAVGRLLCLSQPAVWRWVRNGKPLPAEHVITVERELQRLGSPINRHDLRPDVYPREPDNGRRNRRHDDPPSSEPVLARAPDSGRRDRRHDDPTSLEPVR